MNPLKSQVKISVINDFGTKLDEMLESTRAETLRYEGYHQCLNDTQNATLKSLFEAVDRERDEGVLDMEQADLAKKWLLRVHEALNCKRIQTEKHRLISEGKAAAFEKAVHFAQKMVDTEKKNVEAVLKGMRDGSIVLEGDGEALHNGSLEQRPDGVRPGHEGDPAVNPLADIEQRRAEAKARKAAATTTPAPVEGANGASKPKKKATRKQQPRA